MSLFKRYIKKVIQESNNNEEQKTVYLELLKYIKDENLSGFQKKLKELLDINISFSLNDNDFNDYEEGGYPLINVIILSKINNNIKEKFIEEILSRDDLNLNQKDPHDDELPINLAIKQKKKNIVEKMLNSGKIELSVIGKYSNPYDFSIQRRNIEIQNLIEKYAKENEIKLNDKNEQTSNEIQQSVPKIQIHQEIKRSSSLSENVLKSIVERNTKIIQGSFITAFKNEKLEQNKTYQQNKEYMKPRGLWFSESNEWIKFMIDNHYLKKDGTKDSYVTDDSIFNVNYVIKFKINNKKMYYIESKDSLDDFIRAFGVNYSSLKKALEFDWKKLSDDFKLDGIFIKNDWDRDYNLINVWDIPSGCLWNCDGIKQEKIVTVSDYINNYYSNDPFMNK